MASNPNNSSIVEYCPLRSRYFMCRCCGNNIASANLLHVITFSLRTKIQVDRFPLINWNFRWDRYYGHFYHLENVNLDLFTEISVDRTSDSDLTVGVKKIYCRNCNTVLGEKMVNRPKYYSIGMEKLMFYTGNKTSPRINKNVGGEDALDYRFTEQGIAKQVRASLSFKEEQIY